MSPPLRKPKVEIPSIEKFGIGNFVIVRCRHSGVHCGKLVRRDGMQVMLRRARRVWRWSGANTLNELALYGATKAGTRICEPVPLLLILDAIEIIPCTEKAAADLKDSRWA